MKPSNNLYLQHIRDAIIQIETYAKGKTLTVFWESRWDQAAVIRHLEIIGEATRQITDEYKSSHPAVPWRRIGDFRNVLIHQYFGIDLNLVWEIMHKDIPVLKCEIEKLLQDSLSV